MPVTLSFSRNEKDGAVSRMFMYATPPPQHWQNRLLLFDMTGPRWLPAHIYLQTPGPASRNYLPLDLHLVVRMEHAPGGSDQTVTDD